MSTNAFTKVDEYYVNYYADSPVPSLTNLKQYDAIIAQTASAGYGPASALGDVLADYWDAGGAVVMMWGALADSHLQGRFGTAANGYMLMDGTRTTYITPNGDSLGSVLEPNSPLMVNVNSFSVQWANLNPGSTVNGGVIVAKYASGPPLVVRGSKNGRNMVALNFWPPSLDATGKAWVGNGTALMLNAVLYSLQASVPTTTKLPPTTSTLAPTTQTTAPQTTPTSEMGAYSVGASGFEVTSASYSSEASSWIIDVAYSRNSLSTVLAFFIPRSQIDTNGFYTAQFNSTFRGANFPCSLADLSAAAATTCCLPDFFARYRVPNNYTLVTGGGCTSPYANPPPLTMQDALSGGFGADMPASGVAALPTPTSSPPDVKWARFTLALSDVWPAASTAATSGPDGASQTFTTFVGLAQFAAVPGSRILDSSSTQIQLNLVYSDYYQVISPLPCSVPPKYTVMRLTRRLPQVTFAAGTEANTFLSYINVRANEVVLASAGDRSQESQRAQYASVSFALNENFAPNTGTGLVPKTSVQVGVGNVKTGVTWVHSCEQPVSEQFATLISQPCGPSVPMCSASDISDRFLPSVPACSSPLHTPSDCHRRGCAGS